MNYKLLDKKYSQEIINIFTSVFTVTEGEEEGKLIGDLASKLSTRIDNQEIICMGAYEEKFVMGVIFFTHLYFNEATQAYLLAPVAVSTKHQGKGVGQSLIKYGLNELKIRSVPFVITYGDPAFYSKLGFQHLSEKVIKSPLKLSMPEGWLGCSLNEESIPSIDETPKCVMEFDEPAYW